MSRLLSLLAAAALLPAGLHARITLPAIFGPNMVLQCDAAVPVWGHAAPGEAVAVDFHGQHVTTTAGADGAWRVTLAPMAAGGPFTFHVRGTNTLAFPNVLVGEVWLCSGQSNMSFRVDHADHARAEIAAASHPTLRLFTVERAVAESGPQADCRGHWVECSPQTVGAFSAVAYFFGRDLLRQLHRPVGLIHSSWGGTRAQAWTPRPALAADPALKPILDQWAVEVADFPRRKAEFEAHHAQLEAAWQEAVARAKAAGRMPPAPPRLRTGPNTQYAPCGLYNAMIAPLVPFALRGVAWYQGEANVSAPFQYRRLFPAMIAAWRRAWHRPDLPFLYVQLPNLARQPEPSKSGWAEMREAQLRTLATPHTAMVVTIDVGDPQNLHPTHKQPVGHRLALAAGALVYGPPVAAGLCPVPRGHGIEDGAVRVTLAHVGRGLKTSDGTPPRGFVVAGRDRRFVPAVATLQGDAVVIRSPHVLHPAAARYDWADNPDGNLVNDAGLPASPFRTDDWPTAVPHR